MYSDNGTNFVGAARQLKKDFDTYNINCDMARQMAEDGIKWHFIPPGTLHFGGIWEAGV